MAEDAGNSMKQRLAAGELVLCMNLRLARTVDIAMVAKAGGYDALYVDMQHAPYSIETTSTICAAALGIGITPLVRVPSHDGHWMSRVLDGGAQHRRSDLPHRRCWPDLEALRPWRQGRGDDDGGDGASA